MNGLSRLICDVQNRVCSVKMRPVPIGWTDLKSVSVQVLRNIMRILENYVEHVWMSEMYTVGRG